jgi:hypothetical protein
MRDRLRTEPIGGGLANSANTELVPADSPNTVTRIDVIETGAEVAELETAETPTQ